MRPPAALTLALALLLTGACVAQKGRLYIYCANGTQCNKNLSESGNFCSYIKPGRPLYKAYRPCNYNKTSNKSLWDFSGDFCDANSGTCELPPTNGTVANQTHTGTNVCQPGTYNLLLRFQKRTKKCKLCNPGMFNNKTKQSHCVCASNGHKTTKATAGALGEVPCPSGAVAHQTCMKKCTPCNTGRYKKSKGGGNCTCAPVGHFSTNRVTAPICSPGTFANVTCLQLCYNCTAGMYQSGNHPKLCICSSAGHTATADRTNQSACKAGTYAPTKCSSSCKPCSKGRYTPNLAAHNCTCAPAGHTANDGVRVVGCSPGTYADSPCSTSCKKCNAGKFTASNGSHACKCAAAGHIPNGDGTDEVSCPRGTYSANGNGTCSTKCIPCGIGRFTNATHSTSCTCASAGHTANNDSTGELECRPGTFADKPCSTKCKPCATGRYAGKKGAHGCTCVSAGHTNNSNNDGETPCQPGYYAPKQCTDKCMECKPGRFYNHTGGHNCSCAPGGHVPTKDKTFAQSCPAGTFAKGECNRRKVFFSDGTSVLEGEVPSGRKADKSWPCEPCPAGSSNMHEHAAGCNLCARGHASKTIGSSQVHCDGCTPGRYADVTGSKECKPCERGRFQPLFGGHNCSRTFPGFEQPKPAQHEQLRCKIGFFAPERGLSECLECDWMGYADTIGATECEKCLNMKALFGISHIGQCQVTWGVLLIILLLVGAPAICKCIVLCCKNRGKRKDRRTTYENKDRIDMVEAQMQAMVDMGSVRNITTNTGKKGSKKKRKGMPTPPEQQMLSISEMRGTSSKAVGQSPAASPELLSFLQECKLVEFMDVLLELGVEEVGDMRHLDDSDLDGIDMKKLHKKRLLHALELFEAGGDVGQSARRLDTQGGSHKERSAPRLVAEPRQMSFRGAQTDEAMGRTDSDAVPGADAAVAMQDEAPMWLEKMDPASGRPYYINTQTRATTWVRPAGSASATGLVAKGTTAGSGSKTPPRTRPSTPTRSAASSEPAAKQSSYLAKVDPASGRTYYINKETRATSWQKPADF